MILVTGAMGFIGAAVAHALAQGMAVRGSTRMPGAADSAGVELVYPGELSSSTNWSAALAGVEVVVHTAARVHVMRETARDPLAEFRRVNVQGTANLARQAAAAGVRRFVFVSSIKVNGEGTQDARPFTADDVPEPTDPYGLTKLEAELALREISATSGLELVVIRPPLVYGPGVRANFRSMMRIIHAGIPLPLGAIHNRRSLLALDNLVSLVQLCVRHDAAAGQTFLASDGADLSTTQLLRELGVALGRPARLIPVPASVLRAAAGLVGCRDVMQRLCGSLHVDIAKTRNLLGWTPPVAVAVGLQRAADEFLREARV